MRPKDCSWTCQNCFIPVVIESVIKFEIRSKKSETNPKFECSNDQNKNSSWHLLSYDPVWVI